MKGEFEVIKKTSQPNTIESLTRDFKKLGVRVGSVIIMHSSLSKVGWTAGGAVAIIQALMKILTPEGTLITPTFSSANTDPYRWQNPPVPEGWWQTIRDHTPAFHPSYTPTRQMGVISDTFRTFPDVFRSNHPISSFAAWGKHAEYIIENHTLLVDLGEGSPLSKIYDLNGHVLLLGVPHSNNTSLHLAEYRANYKKEYYQTGSAIFENGTRVWKEWESLDHNSDDFEIIGNAYEESIAYKPGKVGEAEARLLSQPEMIDFAISWMEINR